MSCKIHNNSEYDISEMKPLVRNLYGFAKDRFGFKKPPSINFVSDTSNHPMLGKTAHYDPTSMEITIYTDGRHPKDMMRSIAHELVHHNQNENGMFNDSQTTSQGYAQKDPHLRKMEKQAYLEGNICFRDWEDQYKHKHKDVFYERRIHKMSTKKWKNKEVNTLLTERWGFSMNLDKLNENSKPDYIDLDGDGDKEESMKDAAKDKKEGSDESDENVDEIKMGAHIPDREQGTSQPKPKKEKEKVDEAEMPVDKLAEKILELATIEKLRAALKYAEKNKEKKHDKKDS